MKRFLASFVIFFFLFPIYAQSQKIIPLSSEIYGETDALYLMRGLASPSAARPWTVNEAREILNKIEPGSLNQAESVLYDHITSEIQKPLRFN
jgi:hypothetical protein